MKKMVPTIKKFRIPAFLTIIISFISSIWAFLETRNAFLYDWVSYIAGSGQETLVYLLTLVLCTIGGILIFTYNKNGVYILVVGLLIQIIFAFIFITRVMLHTFDCPECSPTQLIICILYIIFLLIPFIWSLQLFRMHYIKKIYG